MPTDRLHVGERLNFGDSLMSRNNQHILKFREDGNLVLYRYGRVEWHTDTTNRPQSLGSAYVEVEADGNFVVAHRSCGYRWESMSNSYGARQPYLVVEDGGIISLYDDEVDGRHWSSDDFPDGIAGLFEEYALAKRFLQKFRSDGHRAMVADAKFQALRQWLSFLYTTGGVSTKTVMQRAKWTQDHARDLGLISVVNRMQKIRDRIDVEEDAIEMVRKSAPYRLKHLQSQQNGDFQALSDEQQLSRMIRGLIQEREKRRMEQRQLWLRDRSWNSPGTKFGFEHDFELVDDDESSHGNGGSDNCEEAEKVPEKLKHSIDFLLLTIHEVVEFECLTATAECNRAQAWLFHLYIKGSYAPHYMTFNVCETGPVNMWERSSLNYWDSANKDVPADATYGPSEDEDWFGN